MNVNLTGVSTGAQPRATTRGLFPGALAAAMVIAAILEFAVFRHADMLADRSTVAIAYKGKRLEQGRSEQVVILGPSTALAIDARRLQQSMQDRVSMYNYALPNLGTAEQYYFILKKYLQFNRPPDLVVLALPPDSILNESAEQSEAFIEEIERQRATAKIEAPKPNMKISANAALLELGVDKTNRIDVIRVK